MSRSLANIRVVLVETSHPGNIGGVARAMKNMGLTDLVLVNPKAFPSDEAVARAAGADDVLNKVRVASSLAEAVADRGLVIGATARIRRANIPLTNAREAAGLLSSSLQVGGCLVFGRENSGLTNAEMDLCNYLAHIPTNKDFSSLNIAAAVQVFSYECLMALEQENFSVESKVNLANNEQLEGFYHHLNTTLKDLDFIKTQDDTKLMRKFRHLFSRAKLDENEVATLRGVLTAAQKKAKSATDVESN